MNRGLPPDDRGRNPKKTKIKNNYKYTILTNK